MIPNSKVDPLAIIDVQVYYNDSGLGRSLLEMNAKLIGLEPIKDRFKEIASMLLIDNLRKLQNLPPLSLSLHMAFSGNPGVGKRSSAKVMASLLNNLGYLSVGQLVEVTRDDLVGQYVGHTAPKTKEKIKTAQGGVLLLNEAYNLSKPGNDKDYGPEAVELLLQYMENNRDDLVFIFTGQKKKLQPFFSLNPGLSSRIGNHLEFDDYNALTLCHIAKITLAYENQYKLSKAAMLAIYLYMKRDAKSQTFANARTLQNIFLQLITHQAARLENFILSENLLDYSHLTTICWKDFVLLIKQNPIHVKRNDQMTPFNIIAATLDHVSWQNVN